MPDFNRSESFNMKVGIECAQRFEKFDIPFAGQTRMESSHHMHLGDPLPQRVRRGSFNFGYRHFKGVGIPFTRPESTELTGENANIGVVDVAIKNVGRPISIFAPADDARDLPQ
jgi:hypothetical protein